MAQTFSVGDKVVYPGHGVAEITGLEAREISGAKLEFYAKIKGILRDKREALIKEQIRKMDLTNYADK